MSAVLARYIHVKSKLYAALARTTAKLRIYQSPLLLMQLSVASSRKCIQPISRKTGIQFLQNIGSNLLDYMLSA
jgi:hypothetical protein